MKFIIGNKVCKFLQHSSTKNVARYFSFLSILANRLDRIFLERADSRYWADLPSKAKSSLSEVGPSAAINIGVMLKPFRFPPGVK